MMDEITEMILKYNEITKSAFPSYPLLSRSESEVVGILNRCIDEKKSVYELGILPDPSENLDIFY